MSQIKAKSFNVNQVKIIAQSLLHSYQYDDGFPILKELIQNADDAKANELSLFYYDGIENATHPLLKNPGIIVYNDGNFTSENDVEDRTKSNEYGVLSIGGIDKEEDEQKIGKYGLGMKSIFHLCDMFFYYVNKENRLGLINPFIDDSGIDNFHKNWDSLNEEDAKSLSNLIQQKLGNKKDGFTIIIPGRVKDDSAHVVSDDDKDISHPFNKNDLNCKNLIKNLTTAFALLSKVSSHPDTLKKISYSTKNKNISVEVLINQIETKIDNKTEKSDFCFIEEKNFSKETDDNGNSGKDFLDKLQKYNSDKITKNHSAFFELIKTPISDDEKATFSVQYCVYLPLREPFYEKGKFLKTEIDSKYNYTLLINAPFIIDSGRAGILGFEKLSSKVTAEQIEDVSSKAEEIKYWNRVISQYLVFPNLPKIFYEALKSEILKNSDCNKIINALFELSKDDKNLVNKFTTCEYGFAPLYKLNKNNSLEKQWNLIDTTQINKIIRLPFTTDEENILSIFPSVFENENYFFIAYSESEKSLLPYEYNPNLEIIKKLIENAPISILSKKSHTDLFSIFLQNHKEFITSNIDLEKSLIKKINNLLQQLTLEELSGNQTAISRLFQTVNAITSKLKIYSVDNKELRSLQISENTWKSIWSLEENFVLVPKFLNSENYLTEEIVLGTEENRDFSICKFLIDYKFSGSVQHSILEDFIGTGANRKTSIPKIISIYPNIKILELYNVRAKRIEYKSIEEIKEIANDFRLFSAVGTAVKSNSLLGLFTSLIPEVDIFALYTKEDARIFRITENDVLKNDEAQSFFYSLNNQSYEALKYDDKVKVEFVDEAFRNLSKNNFKVTSELKNLFRFILAGFEKIENEDLNIFSSDCSEIWRDIFNHCKNPNTKMIPSKYESGILAFLKENKTSLQVNFINDVGCFNQLNSFSWNNSLTFLLDKKYQTPELKNTILEKMDPNSNEHKTLFKKLPFQKDYVTNEIINEIDGNCFLNKANILFPEGFKTTRKLIKLDDDSRIRDFQERFMKENVLTNGKAVKIVLEEKDSSLECADWIFENMKKSDSKDLEYIKDDLSDKKWIPIGKGKYCSLNEIVFEELLSQDTIDAICDNYDFYTFDDLKINELSKDFIRRNELYFKTLPEFFNVLSSEFNKSCDFYIDFDTTEDLRSATRNFDSEIEFPVFSMLRILFEDSKINNKELIFRNLYKNLKDVKVSLEKQLKALNYLSTKEINLGLINVFSKLLEKTVQDSNFKIDSIKYPTASNEWKNANEICSSQSDSIDSKYILNSKVFEIIKNKIPKGFIAANDGKDEKSILSEKTDIKRIDEFFDSWRKKSEHSKLVDFALYLLHGNFRKSAEQQPYIEEIQKIITHYKGYKKCLTSDEYWNYGYEKDVAFGDGKGAYRGFFKVRIDIPDGKFTNSTSLIGKIIKVELNKTDFKNPIIREPFYHRIESTSEFSNLVWMSLNNIPDNAKTTDDYAKRIIHSILENCYFQDTPECEYEISRIITILCDSKQRTIEGTKERILDGLFEIIRSLSLKNSVYLNLNQELSDCYDKKTAKTYTDEQFANKRQDIVNSLIKAMETDKKLKNDILDAVKAKVGMNQYSPNSVLFELFQNADDSVNDLVSCKKEINQENRTFKVFYDSEKLEITHSGRRINETPVGSDNKKYSQDLLNMLSLNSSDKNPEFGDTGKFGLGFKSIYTICDEPIIRSGELNFKIISGIYPENITTSSSFNLKQTRFELSNNQNINIEEIVSEFRKKASLLTIFSKQIKEIVINNEEKISVKENVLYKLNKSKVSEITSSNANYLLFENLDLKYKILFKIKIDKDENKKIQNISDSEIPKVWCITPLESVKNLPFIINADFVVDTGRLNLAAKSNEKNQLILEAISNNFAEFLINARNEEKISDKYFSEISDIFVSTNSMNDTTFEKFSENVLSIFSKKSGMISSGFGTLISVNDETKIYNITPRTYGISNSDDAEKLLSPVQNFLNAVALNCYVITKVSDKALNLNSESLELNDILDFVLKNKNGILSNEILNLFKAISDSIPSYSLMHKVKLSNLHLKNKDGNFVYCNSIVLSDDSKFDKSERISEEYSKEIIDFLNENPIFEQNKSRFLKEKLDKQDNNSEQQIVIQAPTDLQLLLQSKNKLVKSYYESLYISEFYDSNVFKIKNSLIVSDGKMNETWCILLLTAICQSLTFWGHSDISVRNAIRTFKDSGIIQMFLENNKKLDDVYSLFLKNSKYEESLLRPFEMLLRLFKIRENFKQFYDLISTYPSKQDFSNFDNFLITATDSELNDTSIDLPAMNKSLKFGGHFLFRELLRNDFWNNYEKSDIEKIEKQAFMPKRKVLRNLGLDENSTSIDIYNEISNKIPNNPTLDNTFDILLLMSEK